MDGISLLAISFMYVTVVCILLTTALVDNTFYRAMCQQIVELTSF